jgi:signal transduction histidine kinase
VRDRGHGVPEEFKPRIFEKFAQADNSDARQQGGTGLGLSIVKQIVERLGGTVSFDDAHGGGAIFRVELPAWRQGAPPPSDPGRVGVTLSANPTCSND